MKPSKKNDVSAADLQTQNKALKKIIKALDKKKSKDEADPKIKKTKK
ncbi:MAG: hypothetical protein U9N86_12385 [Bacteroidota bacterium]|nr:hypothetical protein [Bacteroidota bacterium]